MDKVAKIFGIISQGSAAFSGLIAFTLPLVIIYDVFLRYVFKLPTAWIYDFIELSVGVGFFVCYSFVVLRSADVKVDFVYEHANSKAKKWINAVSAVFRLLYLAIIVWLAIAYWWRAWSSRWVSPSPARFPLWVPLGLFGLGLVLTLGVEILRLIKSNPEETTSA